MKTSETITSLAAALSLAQGRIKNPTKDTDTDEGYKTAPLGKFFDATKKIFKEYELSFYQDLAASDNSITVITAILHSSGEWIQSSPVTFNHKPDAEDRSLMIYSAKKSSFCALVGITGEDETEDGKGAKVDYKKHFKTPAERREVKEEITDDLKIVASKEDLEEFNKKHADNIEKLTDEDPNYVADILRDIKILKRKLDDSLTDKI